MTVDAATDPISYAASLLDAVGADRTQVPADIALACLAAADQLEAAGAHAEPIPLIDGDPRGSLRAAMTALADGGFPIDVQFGRGLVTPGEVGTAGGRG